MTAFRPRSKAPRFFSLLLGITAMTAACGGQAAPSAFSVGASSPAAGSAAAKPGDWDQLLAAARKEGAVSIYASQGSNYRKMDVEAFQQAIPGITADAIFVSSAERVSRLNLERQAGRYLADVWISGTSDTVTTVKDAHLTQPLKDQLVLPEVLDPSKWFQNRLWWADSAEPFTTLEYVGDVNPVVFANPKLVDIKSLTSYMDLLDPKWKGKIASTDIRNPGKGADQARFVFKNPELGAPFLTRLFGEMNVKLSDDQTQLINWVAQGVYPIGVFLSVSEAQPAIKQGLDIAIVPAEQFREGASIGPGAGAVAIIDKAPHPNAAKVYVNWLLSKAGQTAWQRIVGDNSLRTDISKDGVEPLLVPKEGGKYAATGTEEYGRLQNSAIRGLIDDAVKRAQSQ